MSTGSGTNASALADATPLRIRIARAVMMATSIIFAGILLALTIALTRTTSPEAHHLIVVWLARSVVAAFLILYLARAAADELRRGAVMMVFLVVTVALALTSPDLRQALSYLLVG
jgi:hypothetical protein